jgi:hypothetical protein
MAAPRCSKANVMTSLETRQKERDSLLLMASLRLGGGASLYPVKVRNLSAGGMMAEGEAPVEHGSLVTVQLRHIGPVEGSVAWVQENRFGVAFTDAIDPKLARAPVAAGSADLATPRYVRPPPDRPDGRLRAI